MLKRNDTSVICNKHTNLPGKHNIIENKHNYEDRKVKRSPDKSWAVVRIEDYKC